MEIILDLINLYPHQISFTHHNKNLFYSFYGIILSVISYIIILALINYYTFDLIYKKNPKLKSIQSRLNGNETVDVSKLIEFLKLKIDIDFNLKNENIDNLKIFDDQINMYFEFCNSDINERNLYVLGNSSKITKNQNYSSGYNYSTSIEINLDNDTLIKKISTENSILKENSLKLMKNLYFKLKDSCIKFFFEFRKPEIVTKFKIKDSTLQHSIYSYSINTEDYNQPKFQSNYKGKLTKDYFMKIYFDYIQINTDSHPFFSLIESDKFPKINFYYDTKEIIENNQNDSYYNAKLLKLQFRDVMIIHSRIYKKILDVLSELGGVFNPLLIIGNLIVFKFNEKKYQLSIINDLFTDEDINRELKKNQKNIENLEFNRKKISLINKSTNLYEKIYDFNKEEKSKYIIKKTRFEKSKDIPDDLKEKKFKKFK